MLNYFIIILGFSALIVLVGSSSVFLKRSYLYGVEEPEAWLWELIEELGWEALEQSHVVFLADEAVSDVLKVV